MNNVIDYICIIALLISIVMTIKEEDNDRK